jgi:hypothetical protein
MTQHHLTPTTPDIADKVVIGYDRPLSTFFVQVYKDNDDYPDFLVWKGCTLGEISSAREAIDLVRPFAHIPDELQEALDDDLACAAFRTNTFTRWTPNGRVEPEETFDAT